jgi:hypothetical protein
MIFGAVSQLCQGIYRKNQVFQIVFSYFNQLPLEMMYTPQNNWMLDFRKLYVNHAHPKNLPPQIAPFNPQGTGTIKETAQTACHLKERYLQTGTNLSEFIYCQTKRNTV